MRRCTPCMRRRLSVLGTLLVLGALWGCSEREQPPGTTDGTRVQIQFTRQAPTPAETERLELRVTSPDVPEVIERTMDRETQEVIVDVPIGISATFQVDAFAATNPVPTFRGRTTVDVIPPEGINVTIRPIRVRLEAIEITPNNPTFAVGATEQFRATGRLSDGTTIDLTTSVVWSTSNTEVMQITPGGLATVVGEGTVTILTTSEETSVNDKLVDLTPTIVRVPGPPTVWGSFRWGEATWGQ